MLFFIISSITIYNSYTIVEKCSWFFIFIHFSNVCLLCHTLILIIDGLLWFFYSGNYITYNYFFSPLCNHYTTFFIFIVFTGVSINMLNNRILVLSFSGYNTFNFMFFNPYLFQETKIFVIFFLISQTSSLIYF